jgi:hypothetical protein
MEYENKDKEIKEQLDIIRCLYDRIIDYNDSFVVAENDGRKYMLKYDGTPILEGDSIDYKLTPTDSLISVAYDKAESVHNVTVLDSDVNVVGCLKVPSFAGALDSIDIRMISDNLVLITNRRYTCILNIKNRTAAEYSCTFSSMLYAPTANDIGILDDFQLHWRRVTANCIKKGQTAEITMHNEDYQEVRAVVGFNDIIWYDKKALGRYKFVGSSVDYKIMKKYDGYFTKHTKLTMGASSIISVNDGDAVKDPFIRGIRYKMVDEFSNAMGKEYSGFSTATRQPNILNRKYLLCYEYESDDSFVRKYGVVDTNGNEIIEPKYAAIVMLSDKLIVVYDSVSETSTLVNLDTREIMCTLQNNMLAIHPVLNLVTAVVPDGQTGAMQYRVYDALGRDYPLSDFLKMNRSWSCSQYPNIYMFEATNLYRLQSAPSRCGFIDSRLNLITNADKITELKKANWVEIKSD